jgi:hypothetical protein
MHPRPLSEVKTIAAIVAGACMAAGGAGKGSILYLFHAG